MKTEEVTNTITIEDTDFTYTAVISTEEATYDYPGSADVEINEILFEGAFNPYDFIATAPVKITQGERLCDTIANNFDSFMCGDYNIRTAIEEDAMEGRN